MNMPMTMTDKEAEKREIVRSLAGMQMVEAKATWEEARAAYRMALDELNQTIRIASDAGMNQSDIGRALGWPRQRVSKLLADLAAETRG
jgi:uncharacterized membrane protein